jgi:general secretion pathway protein D
MTLLRLSRLLKETISLPLAYARGSVTAGMGRRITGSVLAMAALSLAQQPPAAPPVQTQPAQQAVTVPGAYKFNGASLLEVIDILAGELHINYVVDPAVKGGTVTMTTYGTVRDVDVRPLLETILRMNNLAMVQVGEFYRIIPAGNIAKQPVSPVSQTDSSKLPDDERLVLNLVFLRYMSSGEMYKVLLPYMGEGAQLTNYDPANLLLVLDNSRNMRRTLELISIFDNDAFAGQRVRAFDVKNERPTDMAKELESIFKAYSFSGEKTSSAVHFIPVDRINVLLAVAPNPGTFTEVESWIQKLDVQAKVTAGSVDNYVYKLKYAKAENIGQVINLLYGGCIVAGGYGPSTGNSSYPGGALGNGFNVGGGGGGFGGGGYNGGGGFGSPYGGGYGGGQSPYGNNGYGNNGYGNGGGYGGGYGSANCTPQTSGYNQPATAAGPLGVPTATTPATAAAATDQTGSYLTPSAAANKPAGPRVVPNPVNNTLVVQGTPQEWEQIRHLLDQIDVAPRQVLIDAKIYEVDMQGAFSLGVESFLQQKGATNSAGITSTQLLGSALNGGFTLTSGFLVGQTRELLAALIASESTQKSRVLSAPSIIATDSIPASITVGSSVPTLSSEAVSPGVSVGGTSQFTNTVSNTSTGIGLTILARVNPSGVVTMVINQDVTAPIANPLPSGAGGSGIDSPSFSQRNISTQVTVEDGDTIAIGGIMNETTTETSAGIPFLHRLPYIGAAFGTKTSSKQKTELIIFLTPRVIYDTTEITDATEELKQKVRGLRKLIQNQ